MSVTPFAFSALAARLLVLLPCVMMTIQLLRASLVLHQIKFVAAARDLNILTIVDRLRCGICLLTITDFLTAFALECSAAFHNLGHGCIHQTIAEVQHTAAL